MVIVAKYGDRIRSTLNYFVLLCLALCRYSIVDHDDSLSVYDSYAYLFYSKIICVAFVSPVGLPCVGALCTVE